MFTRIRKDTARKLYAAGKEFLIVACKMRPEFGTLIDPLRENEYYAYFDELINAFIYYNCTPETGKNVAYYVAE